MKLPDGYHAVPAGKLAAVVTSVEMFERPALRPEPASQAWLVRKVVAPTSEWYLALYRRVGGESLWTYRLELPEEELRAILHDPLVEVYTLVHNGTEEGLLELDFRIPEQCELLYFGVSPALQGRGAARWLMNRALELAWSRPLRRFWLHTCSLDHAAALQFYIRTGFRPFKREVEIFDDPRAGGLLPIEAARHVPLL
jgi:GNAT superfamily N-acetyltransferase